MAAAAKTTAAGKTAAKKATTPTKTAPKDEAVKAEEPKQDAVEQKPAPKKERKIVAWHKERKRYVPYNPMLKDNPNIDVRYDDGTPLNAPEPAENDEPQGEPIVDEE